MCAQYVQVTSFLFYILCESLSLQIFILIPRPPCLFVVCRDKVDGHCGVGQLSCASILNNVLSTFERDLQCRSSVQ